MFFWTPPFNSKANGLAPGISKEPLVEKTGSPNKKTLFLVYGLTAARPLAKINLLMNFDVFWTQPFILKANGLPTGPSQEPLVEKTGSRNEKTLFLVYALTAARPLAKIIIL